MLREVRIMRRKTVQPRQDVIESNLSSSERGEALEPGIDALRAGGCGPRALAKLDMILYVCDMDASVSATSDGLVVQT